MLHYRTYQAHTLAPWVTFVHGAGGSSSIWYKQIKEYKKHFNVLCIDLRGHGQSKVTWNKGDHFDHIAQDVKEVIDHLGLTKTHMIGISLGTIVVQTFARMYPERVQSLILAGAIIQLNVRTKFLLTVGHLCKHIFPYMWLYRLFAWIIMPRKSHSESRYAFIRQAKKMCQNEFIRWFTLTKSVNPYLRNLQKVVNGIPTLFIMGEEDYLFLTPVKELVAQQQGLDLTSIENCGHVCNIDQPEIFNKISIEYIQNTISSKKTLHA
ncbi:alpha/beta fold hydrolase [Bacillus sp. 2205SS5-2]|uniref:alpha/beta fold hydrolase n=1 Tax=Bacillus sp. 2205SS5-2 TaxID=3109031 RepID=UPI0030069709